MAEIWDWSEERNEHPNAIGYLAVWGGSNWDDSQNLIHPPTEEGRDAAYSFAEEYATEYAEEWINSTGWDEEEYDEGDNPSEAHASAAPIFAGGGESFSCLLCTCCDWMNHKPKIRLVRISEGQK
jgi:hypothetical protein